MEMSSLITKRIVGVQFIGQENSDSYTYFTDIMDLDVDDLVVADTKYGPKTAKVSKVTGLSKNEREKAGKWIICKVDTKAFKAKIEQYNLVSEIEAEIEEQMASQNRMKFYMDAASSNPAIAAMVEKLQGLIGGQAQIESKESSTDGK